MAGSMFVGVCGTAGAAMPGSPAPDVEGGDIVLTGAVGSGDAPEIGGTLDGPNASGSALPLVAGEVCGLAPLTAAAPGNCGEACAVVSGVTGASGWVFGCGVGVGAAGAGGVSRSFETCMAR